MSLIGLWAGLPSWARTALLWGAVALLLIVLGLSIWFGGRASGGLSAKVDGLKRTIDTERRIKDADARGPRTADDAIDRNMRGTF